MTYSMDLRKRVVAAVQDGVAIAAVARRFSVAWPTVRDWRDRAERDALPPGVPGAKGPVKLTPADDQVMREAVAARPGVTAMQLQPLLSVHVVESTICRRLKKLGLTLKKNR